MPYPSSLRQVSRQLQAGASNTYTVHAIWLPPMDTVRHMSFHVDKRPLSLSAFLGGSGLRSRLRELLLLRLGRGARVLCLEGLSGPGLCMRERREV